MILADGVPRRVRSCGGFELPLAPERAFSLFTAEGERRWVPGWSPTILGDMPQHPGMVFLTEADSRQTIWTVIESDPVALRHRYSRVTPGVSAGTVDVQLRTDAHGSTVEVSYDLTALSEEAQPALDAYEGAQFEAMMDEWRSLIAEMLAREALAPL
jgi:hypothetical protein